MNKYFNFKNKNVLIMGGSSGFGAKMAKIFNEQGSNVIIAARNEKKLKKVKSVCKFKKKIKYYTIDVTDNYNLDYLIKNIKKNYSNLNIVLFCCGINIRDKFDNIKLNDFSNVLNTNFSSSINFYKKIFPLIKNKSKPTRIINFTSIFSNRTFEGRTSYSTSKAALKMLTKNLALEWSKFNITVNCISPGPFLTEINLPVLKNKKNYQEFCNKIPLNRFGQIDEIISPVLFLASDYSSYVNGSEIIVDGGWTIK